MEHDDMVIAHTEQLSSMQERLAGLDRRVSVVEDGINSLTRKFDRQGWMLAGVLGGVLLELALMILKH
jgi:tetrahydromethanopterin S-methyltransferase subunit G